LFGEGFCNQLLGWEETSSCGKLFTPKNNCENVSIMSFYKVKHGAKFVMLMVELVIEPNSKVEFVLM
jgi:hypothetical protein